MAQIRLIVGLGNIGSEYEDTRHNAGFWFVDQLARRENTFFREEKKFQAEVARVRLAGQDVWLLKPTTYMNRSGLAVVALALYYKILPEEILVVHDELDLMPGCMKIKKGGGNAGHNGLKDISEKLSTHFLEAYQVSRFYPAYRQELRMYHCVALPNPECQRQS